MQDTTLLCAHCSLPTSSPLHVLTSLPPPQSHANPALTTPTLFIYICSPCDIIRAREQVNEMHSLAASDLIAKTHRLEQRILAVERRVDIFGRGMCAEGLCLGLDDPGFSHLGVLPPAKSMHVDHLGVVPPARSKNPYLALLSDEYHGAICERLRLERRMGAMREKMVRNERVWAEKKGIWDAFEVWVVDGGAWGRQSGGLYRGEVEVGPDDEGIEEVDYIGPDNMAMREQDDEYEGEGEKVLEIEDEGMCEGEGERMKNEDVDVMGEMSEEEADMMAVLIGEWLDSTSLGMLGIIEVEHYEEPVGRALSAFSDAGNHGDDGNDEEAMTMGEDSNDDESVE